MLRFLRVAIAVLAALVLLVFAIANRAPVVVSFAPLPITLDAPLYIVVLLTFALGALAGGFVVGLRSFSRRREASRLRRRVAALEHHIDVRRRQDEDAAHAAQPSPGRAPATELARS